VIKAKSRRYFVLVVVNKAGLLHSPG